MISACFQGKPFNITVIQTYASTTNAEKDEDKQFHDDLQDFLELTPKKDVFFIIGDWNTKVGNQEAPRITSKFGLGKQNGSSKNVLKTNFLKRVVGLPWQSS